MNKYEGEKMNMYQNEKTIVENNNQNAQLILDQKLTNKLSARYPIPTTDLIIEYDDGKKEGIVLITRKYPPYGIALPGGFAEKGLSLAQNAAKEALEETNLEIVIENEDVPLCVRSNPNRDPRDHMISVAYIAKGYGELKSGSDAKTANLYSISEVKDLLRTVPFAFDHDKILAKYLISKGEFN